MNYRWTHTRGKDSANNHNTHIHLVKARNQCGGAAVKNSDELSEEEDHLESVSSTCPEGPRKYAQGNIKLVLVIQNIFCSFLLKDSGRAAQFNILQQPWTRSRVEGLRSSVGHPNNLVRRC